MTTRIVLSSRAVNNETLGTLDIGQEILDVLLTEAILFPYCLKTDAVRNWVS